VIREATGTAGESLSLLAEREQLVGVVDEPTIDSEAESAI